MPKVSIIVPVYNVEPYLARCLDTLINQTIKDIEIIAVNDGSKDNSGKILETYQEKYPEKIKVLNKTNGGLSSARNFGIPYATGEYIAFIDSDDYVEKDMYEKMYKEAQKGDYDMVECDFIWEYPNKRRIDTGAIYHSKKEAIEIARVVAWNKLYKKDIVMNSGILFPEGLRYEDVEFFYKILPKLNKIGFVKEPFIHYIQRSNSISNTQNERTKEIFDVLDHVLEFYKNQGLWNEYKEVLEYTYARYLLCSSLKRMAKIGDKNTRKKLLNLTWERLNILFPEWKKNKLLRKKRMKNVYMRCMNKATYKIAYTLFRIL